MGPVFTRLMLLAMLVIQAPANATPDKGLITGRLLAIDGSPATGVRVMAMAVAEPAASNAVAIVSLAETDSAGRYRLENIPAGKYYITAGLTDLPTYYPGAMAAATATVISVAPGSITNGIDFSMQRGTGVKVAGRLPVLPTLKSSTPIRINLSGSALPPRETTINEDGTFVFPLVRPGTYMLRTLNALFAPTTVVVSDRDVNVVIGGDATGVRVIGKAVVASGGGMPVATQLIVLSASGQTFSAAVNTDGTFEFLRVPPGSYTVRSNPGISAATSTLVVADKDITNLEVSVPFLAFVSATLSIEDGAPPQIWSIEARSSNGIASTIVAVLPASSNSAFTLQLSEGSQQITIRNVPLGYVIKSMTSGDLDLTKTSLDIRPGKAIADIRIVIGKKPIESNTGVKVSGNVFGLRGANLSPAQVTVSLTDQVGPALETTVKADGTFEFPKVPTGRYEARLTGTPLFTVTPPSLQFVLEEPMSGLQFTVSPMTQIRGLVSVVDANGVAIAGLSANISIQIRRDNRGSGSGTSSQRDGTFGMMVAEGEYNFSVSRLPAGYTVKSIRSGSFDITHSPLKVTGGKPLTDIQIVLESK